MLCGCPPSLALETATKKKLDASENNHSYVLHCPCQETFWTPGISVHTCLEIFGIFRGRRGTSYCMFTVSFQCCTLFVCLCYSECWCGVSDRTLLRCSPVIWAWHSVAGPHILICSSHTNLLVVIQRRDMISQDIQEERVCFAS